MSQAGAASSWANLLALALSTLVGAALLGSPPELTATPDVLEYADFSRAIVSGELFTLRGGAVTRALATRTPGYPLLLAAGQLASSDLVAVVRVLHAALGLSTLIGVPLLLRSRCWMWISGPAVVLILWTMRRFYVWPISEWLAVNLLVWFFALCVRYVDSPSRRRLLWIGLVAAVVALTRPALIMLALFPFGFALLPSPRGRRVMTAVALVSLMPILLWMSFNLWRLGSFTLTPFTGPNLFGVASLVGHATPQEGDSPELALFIEHVNAQKRPRPDEPLPFDRIRVWGVVLMYHRNVHFIAEPLALTHGWDRVDFNRMTLIYSFRVIRSSPRDYVRYVLFGLRQLGGVVPLLPFVLAIPIYWLVRGEQRGLAVATLALFALHAAHVALCAAIEVVIPRYHDLTFSPLLGISVVTSCVFALPFVERGWRAWGPAGRARA
jgi:hypothetical protein